MDTLKKKELFTGLMTSMELYDLDSDEPVVLSLEGLSDTALREAVIAEACRHDDKWQANLCMGICRAYMVGLHEEGNHEKDPSADLVSGLAVALYLSWLSSQHYAMIKIMALLGGTTEDTDTLDNISFIRRVFAPPPVAVALKDAYLNLDSLSIIDNADDIFERLTTHINNLTPEQMEKVMEKEGIEVNLNHIPNFLRKDK